MVAETGVMGLEFGVYPNLWKNWFHKTYSLWLNLLQCMCDITWRQAIDLYYNILHSCENPTCWQRNNELTRLDAGVSRIQSIINGIVGGPGPVGYMVVEHLSGAAPEEQPAVRLSKVRHGVYYRSTLVYSRICELCAPHTSYESSAAMVLYTYHYSV